MELGNSNSPPLNKWAFVAKSSMTLAQIVVTVGLGSQFFEGFPGPSRALLWLAALGLTALAVVVYPKSDKNQGKKPNA